MKQIHITETVLRDAQQSLIATRMPFSDFQGILDDMDKAGYHSIECWGGATFDSCLRYLNEDPWERLRNIKSHMKNTKLQMLLRGQNLLGYHHYSDDTVRRFVRKSIENGMDIIRIFDALNDLRNIETAVDECIKAGGHAQGCICYTLSPIHNLDLFVSLGKQIEQMGCHSLCIKDMAGIMSPKECFDLVSALKENISIPIYVHTHATTGLGYMTYLKAAEAGAAGIDCATSAFSGGTSQPATSRSCMRSRRWVTTAAWIRRSSRRSTIISFRSKINSPKTACSIPTCSRPRPMRSFIRFRAACSLTLSRSSRHRTPSTSSIRCSRKRRACVQTSATRRSLRRLSQMVGVQATVNVLLGGRYKSIGKEIKSYIHGEYGRAPGKIDEELAKKVLGDDKPMTGRYADTLEPEFPAAREHLGQHARSEEDVLSYIAFPQQSEQFLARREQTFTASYSFKEVN